MLLAPCEGGYNDFETTRDYHALQHAIRAGYDDFAKTLFEKYPVDSDTCDYFETEEDYAFDITHDGVYMYKRIAGIPHQRTFSIMLTISYTCDKRKTAEIGDAEEIAKDLALNPNFGTIVNGVELQKVTIEEID